VDDLNIAVMIVPANQETKAAISTKYQVAKKKAVTKAVIIDNIATILIRLLSDSKSLPTCHPLCQAKRL